MSEIVFIQTPKNNTTREHINSLCGKEFKTMKDLSLFIGKEVGGGTILTADELTSDWNDSEREIDDNYNINNYWIFHLHIKG